jgi:hypothetical protein
MPTCNVLENIVIKLGVICLHLIPQKLLGNKQTEKEIVLDGFSFTGEND